MKREEVGGRFEGGQRQMTSSGKRRLVSARNQVPRKINCVKQSWLTCDKFFTGPTITMVPRLTADWSGTTLATTAASKAGNDILWKPTSVHFNNSLCHQRHIL